MKLKIFLCSLLTLSLLLTPYSSNSYANTLPNIKTLPELAPYQQVIDKLNQEYGACISIPDNTTLINSGFKVEEVYENLTSVSVEEFEINLRKDYEEYINGGDTNTQDSTYSETVFCEIDNSPKDNNKTEYELLLLNSNKPENFDSKTLYQRVDQMETIYVNNSEIGRLGISVDVMAPTPTPSNYRYSTFYGWLYNKNPNKVHFRITDTSRCSYSYSSDSKSCTATFYGAHYTPEGVILAGAKTYTLTFYAKDAL